MTFLKRLERCRPQWLLALLLAVCAFVPARAEIVRLDHIVAIVNDEVITRQELARRYDETVRNLDRQNTPLPPRAVLEKQLLERMVTELALQQHARNTGIRVDPAQVERALQRIATQNKLDLPALQAELERQGQSLESLRTTIRNEILIARARERDVDNRLSVSDAEIEGYLQTQAQQGTETEYNF
jgi:peptidyl-prolyl cis-trans isomerase SurA